MARRSLCWMRASRKRWMKSATFWRSPATNPRDAADRVGGTSARSSYAVKEIFLTLQGEGAQAGRAAVFCRFAGCNLWSGRESDRATAVCRFCDTDFVGVDGSGGGKFELAEDLARAIDGQWPADAAHPAVALGRKFVVCTGGEPL